MIESFLRPRLIGARFEDHAIPLELLKDLSVLEEFIVEVAKAEFLKDHPERQRTPRGFTEGVTLKLATVQEGSAMPVIVFSVATATTSLFPPDAQIYFERGRDAIVCAIAAAQKSQSVVDILPEKTLGYFDRLGRGLRGNEFIEFPVPNQPEPARLSRETRRRLVLASSTVKELTDEVTVRGTIPEADQDDMTFELQLFDGHKIKAPLPAEHHEIIIKAFNGYQAGQRVAIKGVGRFNRSEKLLAIETVEHVTPLDPLDVPARLDELRFLKDGWFEGHGKAPNHTGMDWLADAFTSYYPEILQLPHLYPTPDGGIRFEWPLGAVEASLDIDLTTHRAQWHQFDTKTDQDADDSFDLSNVEGWQTLSQRVQQLSGGAA